MKNIFILLLMIVGTQFAYAQQEKSVQGAQQKMAEALQTQKSATPSDTTKQKNLGQRVGGEVGDAKDNVVNTGKDLKNKSTAQAKKIATLVTPTSDTVTTDTSGHRKNVVKQEIKKEVTGVKNKVETSGKLGVESTNSQVRKILGSDQDRSSNSKLIKEKTNSTVKSVAGQTVDQSGLQQTKQLGKDIRGEGAGLKQEAGSLRGDIPDSTDLEKVSRDHHRKQLEEKALKLQYSSDDPENAPWKKNPFSKDDLGNLGSPSDPSGKVPNDKTGEYSEKVKNIKSPSASGNAVSAVAESAKAKVKKNDLTDLIDSLSAVAGKLEGDNLKQQLLGAPKIYSEKFMKKLYDSLGIDGADKLLKATTGILKTEAPKEDLLKRISSSISGKEMKGVGYDNEKQSLNVKDADKLNTLQGDVTSSLRSGDLSKLKLPQSILSELQPLSAAQMDSKYLHMIDSMRDIALKAKNYKLEEKNITEDVKHAALKKKLSFMDKSYFEGIIGFLTDSTVNLIQLSPALGYHFIKDLSVGAGPNLQLQLEHRKKLSMQASLRTFVKAEIWKQRFYLQVEDNITPVKVNREFSEKKNIDHQFMAGGGALLPISKSIAINFCVMHRLNKDITNPHRSPWVFRVGLSSIKKK